jgi:hypothetical protein
MQKFAEQLHGLGISGFAFEEHEAVRIVLQHALGIVQGVGMIEFGGERAAITLQDVANQEEIFFLITYQQNAQGSRRWRGRRG